MGNIFKKSKAVLEKYFILSFIGIIIITFAVVALRGGSEESLAALGNIVEAGIIIALIGTAYEYFTKPKISQSLKNLTNNITNTMYCTNCGKQISDQSKFCANCGASISAPNTKASMVTSTSKNDTKTKKAGFEVSVESNGNKTEEKKKWWQYKKMSLGAIGSTALILIIFGGYEFFQDGNGILFGIGIILALIWADKKNRMGTQNNKSRSIFVTIVIFTIAIAVVGAILKDVTQKENNTTSSAQVSDTQNAQNDSWVVYNSTSPQFSVEFPSQALHTTTTETTPDGPAQVDTYKSVDNSGTFLYEVNVSQFPPSVDLSDPNVMLEKTVNLSASSTNGKVITSSYTTHDGYPAINYLIQGTDASLTSIEGLNVLVDQQLYQLITSYDKTNTTTPEFAKFINSFAVQ
jgi:hypothetical protein